MECNFWYFFGLCFVSPLWLEGDSQRDEVQAVIGAEKELPGGKVRFSHILACDLAVSMKDAVGSPVWGGCVFLTPLGVSLSWVVMLYSSEDMFL